MRWKGLKDSSHNLKSQNMKRCSSKRRLKSTHLIQQYSERPYIAFEIVRFVFNDLWTQVIRCTNYSLSVIDCRLEHFGYTEITKLYNPLLSQEDVLGLQISMQNLPIMYMLDCQTDLSEEVQNLVLCKKTAFLLLSLNQT